jgi:pyruvate,water dikinase
VTTYVPLRDAHEERLYGGKAVSLGAALRCGLPVPDGFALPAALVASAGAGEAAALKELAELASTLHRFVAVRSSAVGEDSAEASFAGQHLTVLNVSPTAEALVEAVSSVWQSACSDSARAYRERMGVAGDPEIGAVVQFLIDPRCAGVLFTRNPIDGSDERVIEATWGLGEAVVQGLVIPDRYRLRRAGEVLEKVAGLKDRAVRATADGGTIESPVDPELVEQLCLDDADLADLNALAAGCEEYFGGACDIEWAFEQEGLRLLQCRPVTRAGPVRAAS